MHEDQVCLVALGGNLPRGDQSPEVTLRKAIEDLRGFGAQITAVSRFYRTPCFPAGAGPDYVNAALVMQGFDDPVTVLKLLHDVEARHDRERHTRWAGRTLDLDLIAFGQAVLPDPATQSHWRDLSVSEQMLRAPEQLILPHPRLQDRPFVLIPLLDVAPDWRHPVLQRSIAEFCADLSAAQCRDIVALPVGAA